ncbi:MAG: helix-turn-helix transcriptional regulator [Lachnospiraceae bacterium]|nr:helix-turn-helix transcriptional regulator [Lachnospiraceae bacterium]
MVPSFRRNLTRHCEVMHMGKIILRLDRVMADRKMSLNELSERVGVSNVNLSKIKTGKISAIRFSTLEAICETLDCQPGDILEWVRE